MLTLIGGASRVGKTRAARRLCRTQGRPLVARDSVDNALTHGGDRIIEGWWLSPEHIAKLRAEGAALQALFCGYPRGNAAAWDAHLMQRAETWYHRKPAEDRLALLNHQINFSQNLEAQCAALGLRFLDLSDPARQDRLWQALETLK